MNIYIPSVNDVVHETSVDFILRPCAKEIHIVQYDKSLPIIKVELFRNLERYQLPEDAIVNVRFGKIDHTFVYKHILGSNPERNAIYFEVDEQMALLPSRVGPTIEVIYNNRIANSSPIPLIIDKNPIQNSDTESESYFPIIYELQVHDVDHENRIRALEQGGSPMYVLRLNENPNSVYAHNLSDQYDIRYSIEELANSLVQRDENNKIYASNIVTLDTEQSIEASKSFESTVTFEDTVTILYTPENSSDAIPKSYADEIDERKLELHPFNGFVGGSQVEDQVSNGQIMYCQSGTQSHIDPTQSPIINIELTQEHISAVSNRKAMYIKSIKIWYKSDDDPINGKTWEYIFTERVFGSGSNQDDINPKIVILTDQITGQQLEWTLIYRPATGKQYYGNYNRDKGQQFGSNTNPADYISLYTTSLQNATVIRVEVEISGNSGTNAHGKITLVQDSWKYHDSGSESDLEYVTATSTNARYEFYYPSYNNPEGTHLGTGGGAVIQYEHVFLKKENNEVTTVQANSDYLYIEENGTSDSYRLYKFVNNQMEEVSKTRLGSTADTAYRGDWGDDNYRKITQILSGNNTEFNGAKIFNDLVTLNGGLSDGTRDISAEDIINKANIIHIDSSTLISFNSKSSIRHIIEDYPDNKIYIYSRKEMLTLDNFNEIFNDLDENIIGYIDNQNNNFSHNDNNSISASKTTSWIIIRDINGNRYNSRTGILLTAEDIISYFSSNTLYSTQNSSGNGIIRKVVPDYFNLIFENALSRYQIISYKVSSFQATPDNDHYPTEKLVYDQLALKADKVGPLPKYEKNNSDKVKEFLDNNDLYGQKAFILRMNNAFVNGDFLGSFGYTYGPGGNSINFEFESVTSNYRFFGTIELTNTTTFGDIISPSNVQNYQIISYKVSSFQATPDNDHYPTEKLVYDQLALKLDKYESSGTFAYTHYGSTQGQTAMDGGVTLTQGYIVQRSSNGHLEVPVTPTDNKHAASKKYVDDATVNNIISEQDALGILNGNS